MAQQHDHMAQDDAYRFIQCLTPEYANAQTLNEILHRSHANPELQEMLQDINAKIGAAQNYEQMHETVQELLQQYQPEYL